MVKPQTLKMKIMGGMITSAYSAIVIALGISYKMLAAKQTEEENHRYWKQHTDKLINRLFLFNFFNFYFPMLWVGFDYRNKRNYFDLFMLMTTQMAFKQIGMNLMEYFMPILLIRPKLNAVIEKFGAIVDRFREPDDELHGPQPQYESSRVKQDPNAVNESDSKLIPGGAQYLEGPQEVLTCNKF